MDSNHIHSIDYIISGAHPINTHHANVRSLHIADELIRNVNATAPSTTRYSSISTTRKSLKRVKSVRVNGKGSGSKTKVYADVMIRKLESGEIEYDEIRADFELIAAAGIGTTQQTGSYGFLLLAKHPAVQQRVYDELSMLHMEIMRSFPE